jgi:hypothetical protein
LRPLLRLENSGDIGLSYSDSGILEGTAGQFGEGSPVPRHHRRHQFGNHHLPIGSESV